MATPDTAHHTDYTSLCSWVGAIALATGTYNPPTRGIIISTAGTVTGTLVGQSADVAIPLPTGEFHISFKSISNIGSAAGTLFY